MSPLEIDSPLSAYGPSTVKKKGLVRITSKLWTTEDPFTVGLKVS